MSQALIETPLDRLALEPAVLISVEAAEGSAPREAGAWMGVFADGAIVGSVGGGHLEFEAIELARRALAVEPVHAQRRFALGPPLGQCCGGVVQLRFERLQAAQAAALRARLEAAAEARRLPVALFGGGHVGAAIVNALLPLPARVHWIDSRDEVLPADLPFIGLIGSKSKWAVFQHRLEARGFSADELARVSCPIGVAGVVGKEPEVIAAAVAAQWMQLR